jgi:hypothetical protein
LHALFKTHATTPPKLKPASAGQGEIIMIKTLPWIHPPAEKGHLPLRTVVALLLRIGSRALLRMARHLEVREPRKTKPGPVSHLEFYAESGAPEGAIYADGLLVGYLHNVKRL